ncbi:MAG: type II secretion system F family protein [Thermoleophilia bacterium]|nr:type II secretion system F family protein [Thermoleophilia bacterium]
MIYAAIFVLTLGALAAVFLAIRPGGQAAKTQIALERLDTYETRAFRRAELARPAGERLLDPVLARLVAASRLVTPIGRVRRLQTKVERAGRPWNLDLNGLLAVKFVCLLLGLIVIVVLAAFRWLPAIWFLLAAVAVVAGSYYLPDLLLWSWIRGRQRRIARTLPDFLDLLTVTAEAGLGLDSAMAKIAEKLRDPLREEILITLHHMRIGQTREAALREFAARCDVKELDNFVSALIQSQRLGVPLGKILRTQSDTMRTMRRQTIEEAAQKAPIKMLFPLILCIFPSLFVVILGPAAIRIYDALIRH